MPELIAYASRTGTKRNLALLREAGWRLLVSAAGVLRNEGFPYALDNGAWSAFSQGKPFDESMFGLALRRLGRDADWTVIPDIVAGGAQSLQLSLRWMQRVLDECGRGLLAVQDGIEPQHVQHLIGARVGIFVGGSTAWKLSTIKQWSDLAKHHGAWCHVGRVNTARRIYQCSAAGATSFDGTSATRYAATLPHLDGAKRQLNLGLESS